MSYTIKKLAEKIGVSPTAISLVINDKPNRLKPETVKLIKDSVEKYNYKQNVVARSMVTQSSMSIGLVIPDIRNPFFSEVAMGLSIELQKAGYDTFLCNTLDSNNTSIDYINKLQNRFVDGIIVITNDDFSDDDLVRLNSLRSPVIFLDRNPFNINQNYIRVNDYDGGVMAAKHLLKKYHNFACLKTHPSFSNIYSYIVLIHAS